MTARVKNRESLVDRLRAQNPLSSAAAKAAVDSVALMNSIVTESGLSQAHLASVLGVTEGRVSQILNGDGNVKVATLARFLRAAGYTLRVSADAHDVTPHKRTALDFPYATEKRIVSASEDGLQVSIAVEFSDTHPSQRLSEEYTEVRNLETGKRECTPKPVRRESGYTQVRLTQSRKVSNAS